MHNFVSLFNASFGSNTIIISYIAFAPFNWVPEDNSLSNIRKFIQFLNITALVHICFSLIHMPYP